jgi:hypothetical protein
MAPNPTPPLSDLRPTKIDDSPSPSCGSSPIRGQMFTRSLRVVQLRVTDNHPMTTPSKDTPFELRGSRSASVLTRGQHHIVGMSGPHRGDV